jgi:hypothetical protein
MLENGALVWKTLEDIGAGDGNDNTTYVFTLGEDGKSISIKTLFNGQPIKDAEGKEIDPQVIALDVYTKSEIDGKVETINKAISDEAKRADEAEKALDKKIEELDYVTPGELETTLGDYVTSESLTTTLGDYATTASVNTALEPYAKTADVNSALAGKADKSAYDQTVLDLDALEARVDAFLTGTGAAEDTLDSLQELIEYINTHDDADINGILASIQAIENKLAGIDSTVAAYVTAALVPVNEAINGKVAQGDFNTLAGRVDTLETESAKHALKSELEAVEDKFDDYTTTEALNGLLANKADADKVVANDTFESFKTTNSEAIEKAKTDAIADADAKLANKANTADVYGKGQVYTKDEIDDLIEGIEAGSSESAASVNTKLESLKKVLNTEIYGNEEGTGDSRIDALEAVGAQANVIESVVASETAKVTATKSGKTVTIDDAALVADIVAAKGVADGAAAKALANESNITGLTTRMGNVETKSNENATAIANHATEFATLKGRVDAHDTALDERALKSQVYTKDEVNAITGTPASGKTLVGMINDKANSADVYLKSEVYTKTEADNAIKAITGTPAEGKTIVKMIEDLAAEAYDDTEVRGLIADNANAIKAIYDASGEKPTGVLATEIARVEGLVSAEKLRAEGIEANHEGRIASIENFFSAADDKDETIENLAEIIAYIESDKSGALEMAGNIQANTNAIAAIYNVAEDGTKSGTLVTEIARVEGKADANALAIAAINHETTGILAIAKQYADDEIAKINVGVTSVESGHDALTASMDADGKVTLNFADEIVLNGGAAN